MTLASNSVSYIQQITIEAALGIGLVIAGMVYIAVEGPELVRLSLAFIALVALPLLSYGSVVRVTGGIMIGTVIFGAVYTRISE
jgi:hypothetical protein